MRTDALGWRPRVEIPGGPPDEPTPMWTLARALLTSVNFTRAPLRFHRSAALRTVVRSVALLTL